jgi:integrase
MSKQNLTDRTLKALKPAKEGERYEIMDKLMPGLGIRVTDKGTRTFMLVARYPGSTNPTRRALGEYGALTLEQARDKARDWHAMIRKGCDPAAVEEAERRARLREQENTFAAAAEQFITYVHRQKLRTASVMERDLRSVFIPRWGERPIAEISSGDIRKVIGEAVDREAPYSAFRLFALIRRLLNWAIGTDDFGLELNPCRRLNTKDMIGERYARERVLSDDELRALWRVTGPLPYPFGPLYRLLALTGLRLNEACGAHWQEIDLDKREWTIPGTRMKKVKGGAKPFLVPLTDAMIEVLNTLPRFKSGDFLFSHCHGQRPLKPNQFSDLKERLDKLMLEDLRKMASENGKDAKRVTLPPFVNHDIRRSVRTHLSALKISEEVREAVLAHVRPGIKGVYDKYEYLEEKREALILWNARLRDIVTPPPANIVHLQREPA